MEFISEVHLIMCYEPNMIVFSPKDYRAPHNQTGLIATSSGRQNLSGSWSVDQD
jgi:hypothetical protein